MATFKLQSAMEYLMTYGWAILIIAVVLGALFGLGFFNSANLAPKVSAGGCQVYRPNGPGTTAYINTEGTCNNELPQYVAQFGGGTTANIVATGLLGINSGVGGDTVTFWMYLKGPLVSTPTAFGFGAANYIGAGATNFGIGGTYGQTASTLLNSWNFVAVSFNGITGGSNVYVDGAKVTVGSATALTAGSTVYIGGVPTLTSFNGLLSNVQLYNTSLTSNQITALYQEGIGGVPLSLNNLVGWWQLNGNPNDYGGSVYNGAATGVTFTTAWTSGYTAP